ncbi:MAG: hypothetical protein ACXWZU_04185 [Actinomycetota bacterium]
MTMWIVVVTVVVVSMLTAGIVMALRTQTAAPSRHVPSVTQGAATVVVPEAAATDATAGGNSGGKRQIGSGSALSPGGYVLNGSAQYIPQR